MNSRYKKLLILSFILCITLPVWAQGAPPATPIDGGLSLLLAATGIYGLRKLGLYQKRS